MRVRVVGDCYLCGDPVEGLRAPPIGRPVHSDCYGAAYEELDGGDA